MYVCVYIYTYPKLTFLNFHLNLHSLNYEEGVQSKGPSWMYHSFFPTHPNGSNFCHPIRKLLDYTSESTSWEMFLGSSI